ncbi:MAG: ElyC/SanA/YdcF family protein [Steroidobacteraceae bacterium]
MPLPISLMLVCVGLLLKLSGRPRAGRIVLSVGVGIAVAATLNPVGRGLLLPLETRYHAVINATTLNPAPRYVVVLGSGYQPRDGLSVTEALGSTAVMRLAEGVRLYRQLPASSLIVSGGPLHGDPPGAKGYALAAVALGVPAASIILIDTPVDTGAEIRAIRARVGDAPVLLVTSAAHMPRAMEHCRRIGLHAIAAPTDNLADPVGHTPGLLLLPSGTALRKTETAFHEYFGLLALSLGIG